jgi:hypothetical protein
MEVQKFNQLPGVSSVSGLCLFCEHIQKELHAADLTQCLAIARATNPLKRAIAKTLCVHLTQLVSLSNARWYVF